MRTPSGEQQENVTSFISVNITILNSINASCQWQASVTPKIVHENRGFFPKNLNYYFIQLSRYLDATLNIIFRAIASALQWLLCPELLDALASNHVFDVYYSDQENSREASVRLFEVCPKRRTRCLVQFYWLGVLPTVVCQQDIGSFPERQKAKGKENHNGHSIRLSISSSRSTGGNRHDISRRLRGYGGTRPRDDAKCIYRYHDSSLPIRQKRARVGWFGIHVDWRYAVRNLWIREYRHCSAERV